MDKFKGEHKFNYVGSYIYIENLRALEEALISGKSVAVLQNRKIIYIISVGQHFGSPGSGTGPEGSVVDPAFYLNADRIRILEAKPVRIQADPGS